MTARDLLQELRSLRVAVGRKGEKLRLDAPVGALDPKLREAVAAWKAELLALLDEEAAASPAGDKAPVVPRNRPAKQRRRKPDGQRPGVASGLKKFRRGAGPDDYGGQLPGDGAPGRARCTLVQLDARWGETSVLEPDADGQTFVRKVAMSGVELWRRLGQDEEGRAWLELVEHKSLEESSGSIRLALTAASGECYGVIPDEYQAESEGRNAHPEGFCRIQDRPSAGCGTTAPTGGESDGVRAADLAGAPRLQGEGSR